MPSFKPSRALDADRRADGAAALQSAVSLFRRLSIDSRCDRLTRFRNTQPPVDQQRRASGRECLDERTFVGQLWRCYQDAYLPKVPGIAVLDPHRSRATCLSLALSPARAVAILGLNANTSGLFQPVP